MLSKTLEYVFVDFAEFRLTHVVFSDFLKRFFLLFITALRQMRYQIGHAVVLLVLYYTILYYMKLFNYK